MYVEQKDFLDYTGTPSDNVSEELMRRIMVLIGSAESCVDRITKRKFNVVKDDTPEETRDFWAEPGTRRIFVGDLDRYTAVRVNGVDYSESTREENIVAGRPSSWLVATHGFRLSPTSSYGNSVSVTGVWGWREVPYSIKQATLLIMHRLSQRAKSPLGTVTIGDEMMMMMYTDPDVRSLLADYKLEVGT